MRETTDLTQFLAENETESTREFERKLDEEFELADRYKQLVEVAKFLYQLSSDLFKSCGRNNSFHLQLAKTQLEELGVEL